MFQKAQNKTLMFYLIADPELLLENSSLQFEKIFKVKNKHLKCPAEIIHLNHPGFTDNNRLFLPVVETQL